MEANRNCQNPVCGCGCCPDPEEPSHDCALPLCACGFCTEDDDDIEDDESEWWS